MTTVRCYLPLDGPQLALLVEQRRLDGPLPAATVTEALRAADPTADEEQAEYAAAQVVAARLAADGAPVVLAAADLEEAAVRPGEGAWVTVAGVDLPRVAALHVGDDVATGDPMTLPGPDEEIELSWFDTTELTHVLELLERRGRPKTP